jgi:hypothetical protein
MKLITQRDPLGWSAYDDDSYDGPGGPVGIGDTELQAAEDLFEKIIARRYQPRIDSLQKRLEAVTGFAP